MQERLLQFIWQEKYFNTSSLQTVSGETLTIIDSGELNTQQGPDFKHARILLNGVLWAGNIEVHLKSSQWYQHKHSTDPNYNTVILHVVWEDDDTVLSHALPTLVLENRVPSIMLNRYTTLMQQKNAIACHDQLFQVPDSTWQGWLGELLKIRLQRKARQVLERLEETNNDWEECSWWWLARHFGGPVNAVFFETIARSIPIKILVRHRSQVIQLEAMLLGQGNLLQEPGADPYVQLLQREYRFLLNKYKFTPVHGQAQLLRMRPAGFPAVRLAQLAMLIHQSGQLFDRILDCPNLKSLEDWLNITANDFWHYHYSLLEPTPFHPKHIGKEMGHHLIINGIAPLVFATGLRQQQVHFQQLAINWLEAMPPENNQIQRAWKREGVSSKDAAQSQALSELKNGYCSAKLCLNCMIGRQLLNRP
ncbi:DUF2851 family protein [Flavihumibacter fluvii]|uniref:DUF2851 family protein n=1 Tax=Flavihumibacter fluvii TaxID=2838157 RepID=UPI001BDEC7C6|nr:DUF2851 family protein [Flavihumibacter fluvii]ULQ53927.1 DUF2851 family protein [Flavihumibacter fluvii]